MNTPNDGGPAFPQQPEYDVSSGTFTKVASGFPGMSLRVYAAIKLRVAESGIDWLDEMINKANQQWFAGMALAHWANIPWTNEQYEKVGGTFHTQAAQWSYECADAMLAQRQKQSTEPKP